MEGANDHVDMSYDGLKALVSLRRGQAQLQDEPVHLVHNQAQLDLQGNRNWERGWGGRQCRLGGLGSLGRQCRERRRCINRSKASRQHAANKKNSPHTHLPTHPPARPPACAHPPVPSAPPTFSSQAWRSTAWVWMHTPSTASTTTKAPSDRRAAVETSEQKSTCPGESIRLNR